MELPRGPFSLKDLALQEKNREFVCVYWFCQKQAPALFLEPNLNEAGIRAVISK